MSKSNKIALRKKVSLGLLDHILGHISTSSLMAGDTAIFWDYIDLRIYPYPFCTSCQIYFMNKKVGSKRTLKSKAHFKWVFMNIIQATAPNFLTSETNFSTYLLTVDAY